MFVNLVFNSTPTAAGLSLRRGGTSCGATLPSPIEQEDDGKCPCEYCKHYL